MAMPGCRQVEAGINEAEVHCEAFGTKEFSGVAIASAVAITDRSDLPGFCAIRGTIHPNIGFEARFPLHDWNGKFYQSGCGGYCGKVMADKEGYSNTINAALRRGYAAITTDAGHVGDMGDASWARDNPVAVEVYAEKSIPLTFEAGTAMVEEYYGNEPRYEYFGGCSNGGRMAAIAAQRYPSLFDGILGGGSILNLSENGGIWGSWVVQSNTGPDGRRLITQENFARKLPALEQEILSQCDSADGLADGHINAPRNCVVDVSTFPACKEQVTETCFTAVEVEVLRKWYQGPRDSNGQQLYPGMPAGSEPYWQVWFLDRPDGGVAGGNALGGDYARYLGFEGGAPEGFTALDFDFDQDPQRLRVNGRLLNALDPDLSAFRNAGGKYLMWHGLQDPLVLPDQSIAYYQQVLGTLGGEQAVENFFRLFMIPGMGHCWELPSAAPDQFDPITVLENWVEKDEVPDELVVRSARPDADGAAETVVCPYPALPVFLDDSARKTGAICGTAEVDAKATRYN